jgi:hypothetical protein
MHAHTEKFARINSLFCKLKFLFLVQHIEYFQEIQCADPLNYFHVRGHTEIHCRSVVR